MCQYNVKMYTVYGYIKIIIAFGVQTLPQVRKLMSLLSTILVALAEYHFSIVLQSFVPITNNVHM